MYTRKNKPEKNTLQANAAAQRQAIALNDNRPKSVLQKRQKVNVNDDAGLEKEADVMGAKALQRMQNGRPEKLSQKPVHTAVAQRVELNLPNKGETWTVDSKEEASLKSWIDHQQEIDNFQGVVSLVDQMKGISKPTDEEKFIYHYAQLKAAEIHEQVSGKIARVRTDANPMAITSIPKFIKAQAEYQNYLNGYYSKAEIMKNHQSIGLEFEFATYDNVAEVPSHIDLSQTGSYSALFNLPFVLETDSGKELEIGFPPFLVYIDGHEKTKIKNIWLTMRKEMSKIREASKGQSLTFLLQQITKSGLGTGWASIASKYSGMSVAVERAKHVSVKTGSVYSQLNISMSGKESAQYLKQIAAKGMSTQNEKELIIPVHAAVQHILGTELLKEEIAGMSEEIFIHLVKSSTSIMAIPSIVIQDNPLLRDAGMTQGLFDLQSTVKELHGIWVKDSLPNILRTIHPKSLKAAATLLAKAKNELIAYATKEIKARLHASFKGAQKVTDEYFEEHLETVREAIKIPLDTANTWYDGENWVAHARLQGELGNAIAAMEPLVALDKTGFLTGFKEGLQTLKDLQRDMPLYRPDTTGAEAHYQQGGYTYLTSAGWTQPQRQINELQGVFNIARDFNSQNALETLFTRMITEEIDGTIRILKESKDFVKTPKTGFNKGEKFGTGHGVRKDTHIPTVQTGKGKGKNVAELRGDQVLDHYLDN